MKKFGEKQKIVINKRMVGLLLQPYLKKATMKSTNAGLTTNLEQ